MRGKRSLVMNAVFYVSGKSVSHHQPRGGNEKGKVLLPCLKFLKINR